MSNRIERHNLSTVASAIQRAATFDCNGTLRGEWSWYPQSYGKLPDEARHDLDGAVASTDEALYIVYSYATPIAWYTPGHGWQRPEVKYSPTTSRHQGKCPVTGS